MLEIGFTTIRNVGDSDYNVAGVDQAIEEGWKVYVERAHEYRRRDAGGR